MKKTHLHFVLICGVLLLTSTFQSCQKDKEVQPPSSESENYDVWILNEGSWGGNDAEISKLNSTTGEIVNNMFSDINGRGLGDVAQDMIVHGSKIYVSVWNSNTIEIIDRNSGKSLKQISLGQRGPRYMVGYRDKVYVTCYSKSIVRIDTTSLSLDAQECLLSGKQPEQICRIGDKLYVANCWEYDGGDVVYDSTLSVIDVNTFSEVEKITVGTNPMIVGPLINNKLIFSCMGSDYENHLMMLDFNTHDITPLNIKVTNFDIDRYNYCCYSYYQNWSTGETQLYRTDLNTLETTTIDLSEAKIKSPYAIKVNPLTGNIIITDANDYSSNGDVACITPSGKLLWKSEAHIGPSRICFLPHIDDIN